VESEPLAGQLRGQCQKRQVGLRRDSQIDLGVDQVGPESRAQSDVGQFVDSLGAVRADATQHETLAVIALLHAGIEIAVFVQREEELGHQFLGSINGQAPAARSAAR